jgi:hypothetical protein
MDREDAKDLRRDSLFLAGFSLVVFGIILGFDPAQVRVLLDPTIGLRMHPWLFICIALFATCSQICRRVRYYYEFLLADFLYLLGTLLLYISLSMIVFRMRMDSVTAVAIIVSMGLLIYWQVHDLYSIIQSSRHEM